MTQLQLAARQSVSCARALEKEQGQSLAVLGRGRTELAVVVGTGHTCRLHDTHTTACFAHRCTLTHVHNLYRRYPQSY